MLHYLIGFSELTLVECQSRAPGPWQRFQLHLFLSAPGPCSSDCILIHHPFRSVHLHTFSHGFSEQRWKLQPANGHTNPIVLDPWREVCSCTLGKGWRTGRNLIASLLFCYWSKWMRTWLVASHKVASHKVNNVSAVSDSWAASDIPWFFSVSQTTKLGYLIVKMPNSIASAVMFSQSQCRISNLSTFSKLPISKSLQTSNFKVLR